MKIIQCLDEIDKKFNKICKKAENLFINNLFSANYFDMPNYFFTLFCFIFDHEYRIINFDNKYKGKSIFD